MNKLESKAEAETTAIGEEMATPVWKYDFMAQFENVRVRQSQRGPRLVPLGSDPRKLRRHNQYLD